MSARITAAFHARPGTDTLHRPTHTRSLKAYNSPALVFAFLIVYLILRINRCLPTLVFILRAQIKHMTVFISLAKNDSVSVDSSVVIHTDALVVVWALVDRRCFEVRKPKVSYTNNLGWS